ncbi:MAG: cytochrome oxidase I, partial [Spirochaetia bacterium]|nr:cytochrome oxidase I [Spirochaetia bacterium]
MRPNQYYTALREQLKKGPVQRRTVLSGPGLGDEALFVADNCIATLCTTTHTYDHEEKLLIEELSNEVELVIFGGGHIALELYHIALRLDLDVTIVDEREEFCNPQRFPKARCIYSPFEQV